jgi:hypothetical protein
MKPKYALELEDWGPPPRSSYIKILIICSIVVVIVGFFTGMGIFASMIGRCISGLFGSLFAGIGEALAYVFLALIASLIAFAYAIWLGLSGDWGLFVWLLFVLLGWLLCVGLL